MDERWGTSSSRADSNTGTVTADGDRSKERKVKTKKKKRTNNNGEPGGGINGSSHHSGSSRHSYEDYHNPPQPTSSASGRQKISAHSNNSVGSYSPRQSRGSSSRKASSKRSVVGPDDDEFSVAPSMDQDVKSVVSVGFDDVYQRGRKVRKKQGGFTTIF